MAQAFADDKQLHLDFYQTDQNFAAASSHRARRVILLLGYLNGKTYSIW